MKNKKHKSIKETIVSIILLFVVIFFIGFFIATNWKINRRRVNLNEQILTLEQEIQVLEEKNTELKYKKEETESDEYIEKVARDQLDLKKPGEEVIVVQEKEPAVTRDFGEIKEKETWWERFKNIWEK